MRKHISGFSNPTVKYWRSLRDKKHRKRAQQFLVEGLRLLEDARVSGRLPRHLVLAEGRDAHPLLARLEAEIEAI
ncbi:MAG: RNA methyltransferase, partial [Pseudomonadota bacterium]